MDEKTYLELSESEIKARAKLTPQEKAAVENLLTAVKALPKTLCIAVDGTWEDDPKEPTFTVRKRITSGSATVVASLRKKSLCF